MKDTQSRKYILVINNSIKTGWTHKKIEKELHSFKSLKYYCMADEKGRTFHTHIFASFSSAVRFSTMKNHFPTAHIEVAKGTAVENRDYILKAGKWATDVKHETVIEDSFVEDGELPIEKQGHRSDLETTLQLIKDGASNVDILSVNPRMMLYLDRIEKTRQELNAEQFRHTFRQLEVTYIWGDTGTGKTRSVMDKYGYENVCRISQYEHPFEQYSSQDVIVFDEFRSQFKISEFLNYLDGYPLELPCRYSNRVACYTKVYIISNVPLAQQYKNIQIDEPKTWDAFKRRIHHVIHFEKGCEPYEEVQGFSRIINIDDIPF